MTTKLYSYVVNHDHGYAPNPERGLCSLVHCKFGGRWRRSNIVEMADVGDWILGSGGTSRDSAGHGRIIYMMRVDEKIPFEKYVSDPAFMGRADQRDEGNGNLFALLSHHFFYFGRNAVDVRRLPSTIDRSRLFKCGMRYRADMQLAQIHVLVGWFEQTFRVGVHGPPCAGTLRDSDIMGPRYRCRTTLPAMRPTRPKRCNPAPWSK